MVDQPQQHIQSIRRIDLNVDEEVVLKKNEILNQMELWHTSGENIGRCTVILHITTYNKPK
jgi:hypothetical protein